MVRVDGFSGSDQTPEQDAGCDGEIFGPIVRVSTASSFDDAVANERVRPIEGWRANGAVNEARSFRNVGDAHVGVVRTRGGPPEQQRPRTRMKPDVVDGETVTAMRGRNTSNRQAETTVTSLLLVDGRLTNVATRSRIVRVRA